MTLEEYCNNPDLVRQDAIAAGIRGEAYTHYLTKKGMFTGKKETRYKELNNMELYQFAKAKFSQEAQR